MIETNIYNFCTRFYIPAIQKLEFNIPYVKILGTNHCGDFRHTAFKRRESFQYVLCCSDYVERVVASFDHQIQSEYNGRNISVSNEGIVIKKFSTLSQI